MLDLINGFYSKN